MSTLHSTINTGVIHRCLCISRISASYRLSEKRLELRGIRVDLGWTLLLAFLCKARAPSASAAFQAYKREEPERKLLSTVCVRETCIATRSILQFAHCTRTQAAVHGAISTVSALQRASLGRAQHVSVTEERQHLLLL